MQDVVYGNAKREYQIAARLLGHEFAQAAFPGGNLAGRPGHKQLPVPQSDLDEYITFLKVGMAAAQMHIQARLAGPLQCRWMHSMADKGWLVSSWLASVLSRA